MSSLKDSFEALADSVLSNIWSVGYCRTADTLVPGVCMLLLVVFLSASSAPALPVLRAGDSPGNTQGDWSSGQPLVLAWPSAFCCWCWCFVANDWGLGQGTALARTAAWVTHAIFRGMSSPAYACQSPPPPPQPPPPTPTPPDCWKMCNRCGRRLDILSLGSALDGEMMSRSVSQHLWAGITRTVQDYFHVTRHLARTMC